MPTTAEITQRYVQAHDDIANAITNKGGTVNTGDGFEDFAADIGSIPTPNIQPVTILSNGVYSVSGNVDGYGPVTVTVPNTYTASDEGKVVDNGALVSQTAYPNTITSNNTYNTTLYNSIDVNVPNTYTLSDEGKVVDNGALVSQTATSITTNNTTVDTTLYNSVTVNIAVPQPTLITKSITSNGTYNASSDSADGYSSVSVTVPNTYTALDEGCVVDNGALVPQSSTSINTNGTYNTTLNNSVIVAVPNSYSAGDEGKVVSNGALVSQTSTTITTNNTTVDTTLINSVSVAVPTTTPGSVAYWNTYNVGNTASSFGFGIIGTKGGSGRIFIYHYGVVNTNPFDSFTITDFNLSDYLSTSHALTLSGKSGSSYTTRFTVTLNPSTNQAVFSIYSGTTPPTNPVTYCSTSSSYATL